VLLRRFVLPALLAFGVVVAAQTSAPAERPPLIDRFLSRVDPPPKEYRALRHLDAENAHFHARAWMDAWTEVDARGFRIEVIAEGGSGYVRSRVLRAALEGERKMWANGDPQRAALSQANYAISEGGTAGDRLSALILKPRRKDVLLVDGRATITEEDADLVRIEGRLSKTPSFWTRRVDIVRRYERIAGIRVPVSIESVASVLIAGRSTFLMTYEYETINGHRVGSPQPRTAGSTNSRPE
jgi:hypothetical protein